MSFSWDEIQRLKKRMTTEVGPDFVPGSRRVALVYPSPYQAGMSSLGFQWVYHQLVARGLNVERCFFAR